MKFKINTDHAVCSPVVPANLRGIIKGKLPARAVRTGGDVTNKEFAAENGITTRKASEQRRGY